MRVVGHRVVYGSYGSQFQIDEEGNSIERKEKVKRTGRGRPKKFEISEGSHFNVDPVFYTWALKRHFLTPPN